MKLLILQGLPASGKSTAAKKLVKDGPGLWKRVNKDDLRAMLDNSRWGKDNERFVIALRDQIIVKALGQGYNVVVDDTNLNPQHEADIRQMLAFNSNPDVRATDVELKFFNIPVDECIARDALRPKDGGHVGEDVIRRFAAQLQSGQPRANNRAIMTPEPYVDTPGLPDCVMVDIDGTIAHMTEEGRLRFGQQAPYAWKFVGEDAVDVKLRRFLNLIDDKFKVIFMSGRDGICRPETELWLRDNNIHYDELHMRAVNDGRKDNIVKLELFDAHIRGKYNVFTVFDDRNQVVETWRAMGLTCYQVATGDF